MPFSISYKESYLPVNQSGAKEFNKKHYKNKVYDMYSWTTETGEKKYQVNGKLVHSNQFREILAKEFPEKSKKEFFTLDFSLKAVKDKLSGKFKYYCNGKKITEEDYIKLGNQQKNDFLKSMQSTFNNLARRKSGLSFKSIKNFRDVLNYMLNDFEVSDELKYCDRPSVKKFNKSKSFLVDKQKDNGFDNDSVDEEWSKSLGDLRKYVIKEAKGARKMAIDAADEVVKELLSDNTSPKFSSKTKDDMPKL